MFNSQPTGRRLDYVAISRCLQKIKYSYLVVTKWVKTCFSDEMKGKSLHPPPMAGTVFESCYARNVAFFLVVLMTHVCNPGI